MPKIRRQALINFSTEQMFALVDDIEKYADFLPWCSKSFIQERHAFQVTAGMEISWGGFTKSFITSNRLSPPTLIELELIEGPFSELHGKWEFKPLSDSACEIIFSLDFELNNPLFDKAFSLVFQKITDTLVDAFMARARDVYGKQT